MNPAAETLTGYRLAETQGRALHDVIHHTRPDGSPYPLCECPIDRVFPQNYREQGEEVFVHKDGHFYPVAYTASPIREANTTIGTIIEVRDITQEKLDEQARQKVKTILSSINDGFYTLDRDWRFTYVNDRYCEMVGMQASDLLGQNLWELFPAAVDTEAYRQFHRAVADQTPLQFDYFYTPWNCWHDHRIYPSSTGLTVLIADITQRKQAEAALQKSEERLSLAIDSAGMATWDIDMQSRSGTWSPSHFVMLGYDPVPDDEATYEMWHCRVHPDDLEAVMQSMSQARQTHTLYSSEYRIIRADTGEIRWLKAFGRFVVDAARQTERFVGVLFDVSENKQVELALHQSETQLRLASEGGNFGLWYWDMETDTLTWTDRAKRLFGLPIDTEMSMQVFLEAIHPDDRPFVQAIVTELQANQPHTEIEYRTLWADGTVRWILARGDCDYNADGLLIATRGVLLDITDRKQTEAEREQLLQREQASRQQAEAAEAKLQQVLTSIREEFVLLDRNWHITYLNAQAADAMRVPYEAALGKNLWDLFPDLVGTEFFDRLQQVMRDRTPIQFEYYYRIRDRWFENRVYPAPDGIVNLSSDITARKRAKLNNEFLNQLEAQLQYRSTAAAMVEAVVSSVGAYLNVERCLWQTIELDQGIAIVEQEWQRQGIASLMGMHRISDFMLPGLVDLFHAGQPAVAPDSTTYPYTAPLSQHLLSLDIQAFLSVPCVHEGRWLALLSVSSTTVRQWRSDEVALLQELVSRLWSLIEHTRAVQELHQSEAEFRQLANAMPQIVHVSNADGRLEFINDRWTEYTGLTLEQSQNLALIRQIIPPEDHEQLQIAFAQAQETRSPYQSQFRLLQPDGSYLYFLSRAVPVLDSQGQVRRWYGTSTDITGLKQLEVELRQKNAILDVINESAPTPIFVKDRQGRIIYANPATLEVLGKTAEAVIGYRDCDLYPNPDDAARVMENDRRIMESGQMEVVEESPDGVRIFLGMKAPYCNEAGEVIGLIGISNDITDRVQLERDRERILRQEQAARETAENANRVKDEFLAVLSHELRSPLNPILGWSKLLQQGKLDATRTQIALDAINRNAQLQVQLIDDLLDISRILRGKLSLNVLPVDLDGIISAALETVHLAAEAKSLHLRFTPRLDSGLAAENSTLQVLGDAGRLQQVVWNLLSNAVKFTPQGGEVTVALTRTGTNAQIQVIDTGKGIKPDFLPHVFEHFRQEDGATTRQFGGLGLGLAIARQIVEMHGGQISANSLGEGQGATFIVQLPLVPGSHQLPCSKPSSALASDLHGIHILVVDDEPDSREIVAFILEQAGASVTSVSSGIEGLQVVEATSLDLIVSDIGMPEMDGYMLLQQVRALESVKQIPAIALTAYAGEFDRQQALRAGFQRHLAKPIEPNELIAAVSALFISVRTVDLPGRSSQI